MIACVHVQQVARTANQWCIMRFAVSPAEMALSWLGAIPARYRRRLTPSCHAVAVRITRNMPADVGIPPKGRPGNLPMPNPMEADSAGSNLTLFNVRKQAL